MRLFSAFLLLLGFGSFSAQAQYTDLVDPFWGSEYGNVFPGACLPFGMVKVSPDGEGSMPTNGYSSDKPIVGFSHNHLSGTGGGGRYGNILVTPTIGPLKLENRPSQKRENEYAKPGYYKITLKRSDGDVSSEITTSARAALHSHTFYTWKKEEQTFKGNVWIDLAHSLGRNAKEAAQGAKIKIVSDKTMSGHASFKGGWGGLNPYTVYFFVAFDTPFDTAGTWSDANLHPTRIQDTGRYIGAFARFVLKQKQEVKLKLGISYISEAQAQTNTEEIKTWDFAEQRMIADSIWNAHLGKVQVQGGTPEQRMILYTSLYHTLLMPTDVTRENPKWTSFEPHYWDHYCLWDVFRCTMPLHTILYPDRQRAILRSFLDIYKQRGWLPDAWIAGDYASVQGGSNSDVVFADAIVKKLGGFDQDLALRAITKNALIPSENPALFGRYRVKEYLKKGYVPVYPSGPLSATSRSLEYAYNDFCIGQAYAALDKSKEAAPFYAQSLKIFNLFHPTTKFFWAKDPKGNWLPNFNPEFERPDSWNDPVYMEGTAWNYSLYAPHDMQGLLMRHGGKEPFVAFVDSLFDKDLYHIGNEPEFYIPYTYHYAGRPDKTALRIRHILAKKFVPGRRGLPGQDDSGALSAWSFWGLSGLFPIPGQSVYLIAAPHFQSFIWTLENGKTFHVVQKNAGLARPFIVKATLNGKDLATSWISHEQLMQGGVLELSMGDKASDWGTENLPPSLSVK